MTSAARAGSPVSMTLKIDCTLSMALPAMATPGVTVGGGALGASHPQHPHGWRTLVAESGWSWDRAETAIRETAIAALY